MIELTIGLLGHQFDSLSTIELLNITSYYFILCLHSQWEIQIFMF